MKAKVLGQHSGPLRLVAFSDYRVQDIELLIEELSKLQPRPDLILYAGEDIAQHLNTQRQLVSPSHLIVVSHTPPEGILDHAVRFSEDGRPRSIGSRALKKFLKTRKEVVLVVCGHVHRCGGMHQKVSGTTVVN